MLTPGLSKLEKVVDPGSGPQGPWTVQALCQHKYTKRQITGHPPSSFFDVIYGWSFTCLTLRKIDYDSRWNNHIFNFGNRDGFSVWKLSQIWIDLKQRIILDQQICSLWNCDCFLVWNRSQFWKFQALQIEIIFSWSTLFLTFWWNQMKVNCRCNQVLFWKNKSILTLELLHLV